MTFVYIMCKGRSGLGLKRGNLFFRLVKVFKNVEVEVAELAMVTMEAFARGVAVDRLCRTASEKMSLTVCFKYNKGIKPAHFNWSCVYLI